MGALLKATAHVTGVTSDTASAIARYDVTVRKDSSVVRRKTRPIIALGPPRPDQSTDSLAGDGQVMTDIGQADTLPAK